MAESVGDRLYLIRLACGDGLRRAESQEDFAERVRKATGKDYLAMSLSLLERMKQGWKLEDVETFAAVDPKRRGKEWLAFGTVATAAMPDPQLDRRLTEQEELRALRKDAADERVRTTSRAAKKKPKRA